MQMDVHKTLKTFYTSKKIFRVAAKDTKMHFVGRNSQVYYVYLHFTQKVLVAVSQKHVFHLCVAFAIITVYR